MDEGGFFKKITVIGLGLIGGSICKALKASEFKGQILGIDSSNETLKFAIENSIVDQISSSIDDKIIGSDLVIIATYLNHYEDIFLKINELGEEFLILDTGSVKSFNISNFNKILGKTRFVGGHPLAGSEKTGILFSESELFVDKIFYIIKYSFNDSNPLMNDDMEKITQFTKLIRAKVQIISEDDHDEIMALTSHLPHFIASLQMNVVMDYENIDLSTHIGRGFIDSTRIASSSPELWTDVFQMNKENIIKSFEIIESSIEAFKKILIDNDASKINDFFENARKNREKILENN